MNYIKIGETLYPAYHYSSIPADGAWYRRETRQFTLDMPSAQALEIFVDGLKWELVHQRSVINADGEVQTLTDTEDMSEFCVAGTVTDNRDGTSTVKMGTVTAEEKLMQNEEILNILLGGATV